MSYRYREKRLYSRKKTRDVNNTMELNQEQRKVEVAPILVHKEEDLKLKKEGFEKMG